MNITELIFRQDEQRRIEESEIRSGQPLDVLRIVREANRRYLRINGAREEREHGRE